MSDEPRRRFWEANLQGNLIAGMLTITPLVVVWFVFDFFLNALSAAARPLADSFAVAIGAYLPSATPWMMSGSVRWCLAVVVSLLVLYSIGAIASCVAGQKAL